MRLARPSGAKWRPKDTVARRWTGTSGARLLRLPRRTPRERVNGRRPTRSRVGTRRIAPRAPASRRPSSRSCAASAASAALSPAAPAHPAAALWAVAPTRTLSPAQRWFGSHEAAAAAAARSSS
eukprot:scaffold492_cov257-Pinguiococcus_pyrenoidosus.AAC.9